MVLDPTTDIGRIRLRVGDWNDIPWFQDNVYQAELTANSGNVLKTARTMANYILATLTRNTQSKLAQIESYDNQQFQQYKEFLLLTVKDPAFMDYAPLARAGGIDTCKPNPLIQFGKAWNANYANGTSTRDLNLIYSWTGKIDLDNAVCPVTSSDITTCC